ncbi:hypothetical protein OPV22_016132 [Ensete ventricosum]|uniref:Uncharacterized protein n=1 Tax=Ensete ventricosum TaxID=4639 RepID=A0AAV8QP78_ENSVE|nr:hypothetical protein OPV22_016132 [Ensete ventricosum]
MEAILCLPSALSAPFKGPGRLLLHRHTRNHALLGRISFPRSRPRSHTVVSLSHVPPPPPSPPRPEEDKGRAGLTRAGKGVKVGAAVVAAVACALGAVTVLRGAPVAGGPGTAMAVGTPGGDGKSVTMTAGNTGCSSRGDANQQGGDVGTGVQRTPNMVREILFGTACKKPWVSLLDHAFTEVLPPSKRLQLMNLIYQLDQSIPSKKAQKISEIFSSKWLSGDEKHEVGITLTQVYIDLKDYRTAKEVCTLISGDLPWDSRPPLLMAVIDMMLATEKLLSMNTGFDDPEVQKLINAAKESWGVYKELDRDGFGSEPT